MFLPRPSFRLIALVVSFVALFLAGEARAACVDGQVDTCSSGGCLGRMTCEGLRWGPCEFTGASNIPCSVCGRGGTLRCTAGSDVEAGGGQPIPNSCTAYRLEVCNGCDDDGDGSVDENASNNGPLTTGACESGAGCPGTSTCVNGALQCKYQAGARRSCIITGEEELCFNPSAECRADGTLGPCQPPVSGPEDCNGCDDDYDGVIDNNPGQGPQSLSRSCQSSAGECLGSSQTCVARTYESGYVSRSWGACAAPAESCNGADDDCDGSIDESDVCRTDTATCACQPVTFAQLGKNCGTIDDGCGWPLNCGTCPGAETCGGSGIPNVCSGCTPRTQAQACQGRCGTVSNGCTGTYDCGGCASPQTCGGGGTPNVCGCTPVSQTTACQGRCGTVSNGCTGTYDCGGCASPQTCGGGGTPNVCGCTPIPQATACAGKNCGTVSNGCGGTYNCGTCSGYNSCGGSGTANVCGCTPLPRYEACGEEQQCGSASNGCGGSLSCGTCPRGTSCKGGVCWGSVEL